MEDQEIKADKDENLLAVPTQHFNSFEQFMLHALDCSDPNCPFSLCVNTKLMFKHTQQCTSTNCSICEQARSLALNHSKTCREYFCCIPFCMEAKQMTFVESQITEQRTRHTINSLNAESQNQIERIADPSLGDNGLHNTEARSHLFEQTSAGANSHLLEQTSLCPKRVRSSSVNLNSPAQKSSPSLKRLNTKSSSPKAVKKSSNCPISTDQKTSPSPHLISEQNRCPSQTTSLDDPQRDIFKDPFRGSQESPVTIMVNQTKSYPSFAVKKIIQDNSGTQTECLRETSSACSNAQEGKYQNHQTDLRGKSVREPCDATPVFFQTSQQQQPSQNSVRAQGLSLRSKSDKTANRLLKKRFFEVLFGLQRLILSTKTRQEILICVGSLRCALQEIYNLD